MDKVVSLEKITRLCSAYRGDGRKIVFTNGCFDLLHIGHVTYLEAAARLGDILVLGLNSDASVRQIKGPRRPVIEQSQRAGVVSALFCIDHVVLFDEPDPLLLIKAVQPDILVKGADWPENQIVGADFVKQHGGRVERIRLEPEISTTKIIERIGCLYYGKRDLKIYEFSLFSERSDIDHAVFTRDGGTANLPMNHSISVCIPVTACLLWQPIVSRSSLKWACVP